MTLLQFSIQYILKVLHKPSRFCTGYFLAKLNKKQIQKYPDRIEKERQSVLFHTFCLENKRLISFCLFYQHLIHMVINTVIHTVINKVIHKFTLSLIFFLSVYTTDFCKLCTHLINHNFIIWLTKNCRASNEHISTSFCNFTDICRTNSTVYF